MIQGPTERRPSIHAPWAAAYPGRLIVVLVVACVVGPTYPSAMAQTPPRVIVHGTVVRKGDNKPLPDVEVVVTDEAVVAETMKTGGAKNVGKTDALGEFSIDLSTRAKSVWCRVRYAGYDPVSLHVQMNKGRAEADAIQLRSYLELGTPIVANGDPSKPEGLLLTLPVKNTGKESVTLGEIRLDGAIGKSSGTSCADPATWISFGLSPTVSVEDNKKPDGPVGVAPVDSHTVYAARAAQFSARYNGCSGGDYTITMSGPPFSIPPRSQSQGDYHIEVRFPAHFDLVQKGAKSSDSPQLAIKRCPTASSCDDVLHATLHTVEKSSFTAQDVSVYARMANVRN